MYTLKPNWVELSWEVGYPPPATDPYRTACTPLYTPVQAVPPLLPPPFISCPDRGTGEGPTCARDRRTLQQLALNVHVTVWPDLT